MGQGAGKKDKEQPEVTSYRYVPGGLAKGHRQPLQGLNTRVWRLISASSKMKTLVPERHTSDPARPSLFVVQHTEARVGGGHRNHGPSSTNF